MQAPPPGAPFHHGGMVPPSQTIYVNNINDKVKKEGKTPSLHLHRDFLSYFLFVISPRHLPFPSSFKMCACLKMMNSRNILLLIPPRLGRSEEGTVRHLWPVWPHLGRCCLQDFAFERTSVGCIRRCQRCFYCSPDYARLPFHGQAH
mmetsp:Transcript_24353/g.61605  ORF Transcript_24353/g.61605 Transcript_24353/m.61605 type:complete len:147 (+) Transcript_24353:180-620(+)